MSFFFLKRLLSFGCTSTWHTAHTNTYIKTELQKSVIHTLLILFRHVQGTWESCLSHAMTAVGKKIKKLRKSHMDPICAVIMLSLAIKHFCDTTHRLIFQHVLSSYSFPLHHSPPITPTARKSRWKSTHRATRLFRRLHI